MKIKEIIQRLAKGLFVLWFGAMALLSGQLGYAQTNFGSIVGAVTDASGAQIPGAEVAVTNNGTNAEFTTKTGSGGTYSVLNLNPGTYTVTVALTGFKTTTSGQVDVTVGGTAPAGNAFSGAGSPSEDRRLSTEPPAGPV
jgi:hypothetical protein